MNHLCIREFVDSLVKKAGDEGVPSDSIIAVMDDARYMPLDLSNDILLSRPEFPPINMQFVEPIIRAHGVGTLSLGFFHAAISLRFKHRDKAWFVGRIDDSGCMIHGAQVHIEILEECWDSTVVPASYPAQRSVLVGVARERNRSLALMRGSKQLRIECTIGEATLIAPEDHNATINVMINDVKYSGKYSLEERRTKNRREMFLPRLNDDLARLSEVEKFAERENIMTSIIADATENLANGSDRAGQYEYLMRALRTGRLFQCRVAIGAESIERELQAACAGYPLSAWDFYTDIIGNNGLFHLMSR